MLDFFVYENIAPKPKVTYLTDAIFETGASGVPSKSQKWGGTNFHLELPRLRDTPLILLVGATVAILILDAVHETKAM